MREPEPLSPKALEDAFNSIRKEHGLPEVTDVSASWNTFMDKIGAERGTWEELTELLGEES